MTEAVKPWWASRAIWGGLAAMVAGIGMMLGIDINAAELTDALASLGAVVGGLLAVGGRVAATKRIG
jgi:hypothetical protein